MEECMLIDNFRQEARRFKSIALLKRYARENNLVVKENKHSMHSGRTFYTEGI